MPTGLGRQKEPKIIHLTENLVIYYPDRAGSPCFDHFNQGPSMKEIEREIKANLSEMGMPLSGIAAVRELERVPRDFSPGKTLAGAQSVISFGLPVPKGVIYSGSNALDSYWRYCNMSYRLLDTAAMRLCVMIEERGFLACPAYGCFPWKISGKEYWGVLPLVYWAKEAGLGGLTRAGLLAEPIHGTRVLLGGVITDAELAPSARVPQDPCPQGCRACIDACPVKAIAESGKVDHGRCMRRSGANPLLWQLLQDRAVKEKFSLETLFNTVGVDDHGAYTCFRCVEVCPLNA